MTKIWYLISYRFIKPKLRVDRAILSGDGSFIDIRYWLSRPDKVQGRMAVYLIEEATGEKFELMRFSKFGPIRTRHSKYKTTGILLFRNRNYKIRAGTNVTLVFGPLHAKNIEVG